MLSLFPSLFDLSWYVPLFFRIFLGYYFFNLGLYIAKKGSSPKWRMTGWVSSILGIFFILGLLTQLSGLISSIFAIYLSKKKNHKTDLIKESHTFYALIALVSLSLLFLGSGPYAIDLPL